MTDGNNQRSGYRGQGKPRWGALALIAALHVLALLGLARAFVPGFSPSSVEGETEGFTVIVTTPEDIAIPPELPPEPNEGAQAEQGERATPRETSAPETRIAIRPVELPEVTSTGSENRSGAREEGDGTGAGGDGIGTGSGNSGTGAGSGCPPNPRPVKIEGDIRSASDYPIPEGGRQARFGTSVTIALTVDPNGNPAACRVHTASPFPDTDQITCDLAMERFRFCPATNPAGEPISGTFGWRQTFREAQ